jgi:hypothetical protein
MYSELRVLVQFGIDVHSLRVTLRLLRELCGYAVFTAKGAKDSQRTAKETAPVANLRTFLPRVMNCSSLRAAQYLVV